MRPESNAALNFLIGDFMTCQCTFAKYCDHHGRSFCNSSAVCYQASVVKPHKTTGMSDYDPLCIKSDVCNMAICDGAMHRKHAVRKSTVLVQRSDSDYAAALRIIQSFHRSSSDKPGVTLFEFEQWLLQSADL
jgi:hypothetical protein